MAVVSAFTVTRRGTVLIMLELIFGPGLIRFSVTIRTFPGPVLLPRVTVPLARPLACRPGRWLTVGVDVGQPFSGRVRLFQLDR